MVGKDTSQGITCDPLGIRDEQPVNDPLSLHPPYAAKGAAVP